MRGYKIPKNGQCYRMQMQPLWHVLYTDGSSGFLLNSSMRILWISQLMNFSPMYINSMFIRVLGILAGRKNGWFWLWWLQDFKKLQKHLSNDTNVPPACLTPWPRGLHAPPVPASWSFFPMWMVCAEKLGVNCDLWICVFHLFHVSFWDFFEGG